MHRHEQGEGPADAEGITSSDRAHKR